MSSYNVLVPRYLILSLAYYHYNVSLIEDSSYDKLCKTLLENWKDIKHPHKKLVKKKNLEAGTGFNIKLRDYPMICLVACSRLIGEYNKDFRKITNWETYTGECYEKNNDKPDTSSDSCI